jgi:3-phenylpropionate/trans-cinnamate dioxygenase ferredoxin reductase subunit
MDTERASLLVVGAGHAGSELAVAARQGGWNGPIVLVGDEPVLPYQRPPLSKAYLLGRCSAGDLALRPAAAYDAARIERLSGARVSSIDRAARGVAFDDGRTLRYGKLALCLGGRPRPLACEGLDPAAPPSNLRVLRTVADADGLRAALAPGVRLVVVGAGYVGLEVAASARQLGAEVTVLESQPRVLARVAGADVSRFCERLHRDAGVVLLTGAAIARVELKGGLIVAVHLGDGQRLQADLVLAGIGMLPNLELARAAGLAGELGIPVDELACTADPHIVAAGDCTVQQHALYGGPVRIESVPNALEQARAAASWLCGDPRPNRSVPWFWSDQYGVKLQMAGLSQGHDHTVLRGDPAGGSFCVFYLHGARLLAVDAVSRPADFMWARRALGGLPDVDADRLADESVPLKDVLPAPPASAGEKP